MSLDLTKAPWPEWEKEIGPLTNRYMIGPKAYAFARHRVNLQEWLLKELEKMANEDVTELDRFAALALTNDDNVFMGYDRAELVLARHRSRRLRQLLARAKQEPKP